MVQPRNLVVSSLLLFVLAGCLLFSYAPVCRDCVSRDVWLTRDGAPSLHARIYLPGRVVHDLPAVLVLHGYLANGRFLEVPWAEDLTRLGVVSLFLDRQGYGRSDGEWWRRGSPQERLQDLYPDIRRAIAYLRDMRPEVDGSRVALLGHSDGATGSLVAASADWDVAATVALSSSVAPSQYVNHVAPRNLLMIYGEDDHFILNETDALLIQRATRGVLENQGRVGALSAGSARELLRIPRRGHLDVIYDDAARHAALDWLAETFGMPDLATLAPLRWTTLVVGIAALLMLLASTTALSCRAEPTTLHLGRAVVVLALWMGILRLAAIIGPALHDVPTQEGGTVVALALCSAAVPLLLCIIARSSLLRGFNAADMIVGIALGVAIQAVVEVLLRPVYDTPITAQRMALGAVALVISVPAFVGVTSLASWPFVYSNALNGAFEGAFAISTICLATLWFVRMSALPVILFGFAIAVAGALRQGGWAPCVSSFCAAVVFARCASIVCAFY